MIALTCAHVYESAPEPFPRTGGTTRSSRIGGDIHPQSTPKNAGEPFTTPDAQEAQHRMSTDERDLSRRGDSNSRPLHYEASSGVRPGPIGALARRIIGLDRTRKDNRQVVKDPQTSPSRRELTIGLRVDDIDPDAGAHRRARRMATELGAVQLALDAADVPRTSEGEQLSSVARVFKLAERAAGAPLRWPQAKVACPACDSAHVKLPGAVKALPGVTLRADQVVAVCGTCDHEGTLDSFTQVDGPAAFIQDPVPLVGHGPEGQRLWLIGHSRRHRMLRRRRPLRPARRRRRRSDRMTLEEAYDLVRNEQRSRVVTIKRHGGQWTGRVVGIVTQPAIVIETAAGRKHVLVIDGAEVVEPPMDRSDVLGDSRGQKAALAEALESVLGPVDTNEAALEAIEAVCQALGCRPDGDAADRAVERAEKAEGLLQVARVDVARAAAEGSESAQAALRLIDAHLAGGR